MPKQSCFSLTDALFSVTFLYLITVVRFHNPASALVVRLNPTSDDLFAKAILLPVQIPRLLQDPQNVPWNNNRSFGFKKGGELHVDLEVLPPTLAKPLDLYSDTAEFNSRHSEAWKTYQKISPISNKTMLSLVHPRHDDHLPRNTAESSMQNHFNRLDGSPFRSILLSGSFVGIKGIFTLLQALGGGIAHLILDNALLNQKLAESPFCQLVPTVPKIAWAGLYDRMNLFGSILVHTPRETDITKQEERMILLEQEREQNQMMMAQTTTTNAQIKGLSQLGGHMSQYAIHRTEGVTPDAFLNSSDFGIAQYLELASREGTKTRMLNRRELIDSLIIHETQVYILLMTDEQWVRQHTIFLYSTPDGRYSTT